MNEEYEEVTQEDLNMLAQTFQIPEEEEEVGLTDITPTESESEYEEVTEEDLRLLNAKLINKQEDTNVTTTEQSSNTAIQSQFSGMKNLQQDTYTSVQKLYEVESSRLDRIYKEKSKQIKQDWEEEVQELRQEELDVMYARKVEELQTNRYKKLKSMGLGKEFIDSESQGLDTPVVSPEFGAAGLVGGMFGKNALRETATGEIIDSEFGDYVFGDENKKSKRMTASESIGGEIGAEFTSKIFDAAAEYLTPEFKAENPTAYAMANLFVSALGGKVGADGTAGTAKAIGKVSSKGITGAYNTLFGKSTTNEALDYITKRTGETEDSLNSMYQQYANSTKKDIDLLTDEDKINAILSNSRAGTAIKLDAEYYNSGVLAKLNQTEETLRQTFTNLSSDGNLIAPAFKIKEFLEDSSGYYQAAKDALINNFTNTVKFNVQDSLNLKAMLKQSSMSADDQVVVKKVLDTLENSDGLSIEQLLGMKQDLNALNLTSTKGFKADQVGNLVDDYAKKILGEDSMSVWKEVNKRYAAKSILEQDNPVAKKLLSALEGEENITVITRKLLKDENTGFKWFKQLQDAIGDEQAGALEKGLVNSVLTLEDNKSMSEVIKKIKEFDFMTAEGKSLKNELVKVEGLVSNDDAIDLLNKISNTTQSSTGWSDSIRAKAKYWLIGKIWNKISTRLPSGTEERRLNKIADIISNKEIDVNGIKVKKSDLAEMNFREEQERFRSEINKLTSKGKERTKAENERLFKLKQKNQQLVKVDTRKADEVVAIIDKPSISYNNPDDEIIDTDVIEGLPRYATEPTMYQGKGGTSVNPRQASGQIKQPTGRPMPEAPTPEVQPEEIRALPSPEDKVMYQGSEGVSESQSKAGGKIKQPTTKTSRKSIYQIQQEAEAKARYEADAKARQELKAKNSKLSKEQREAKAKAEAKGQTDINFDNPQPSLMFDEIKGDLELHTGTKREVMILDNGTEVTKTQWNEIESVLKKQKARDAAARQGKPVPSFTEKQRDTYRANPDLIDNLKDTEWTPAAADEMKYPSIYDFMTKAEMNKAMAYAKNQKTKAKGAKEAYKKWLQSKKKVNESMKELEDMYGF